MAMGIIETAIHLKYERERRMTSERTPMVRLKLRGRATMTMRKRREKSKQIKETEVTVLEHNEHRQTEFVVGCAGT